MRIPKIVAGALLLMALVFTSLAFAQQKPAAGAAPAQEVLGVMDIQVKPGMGLEWENYLKKDLLPAIKKAGMKNINTMRTEQFGIGDRYAIWWPITSLAELDGPDPFEKALGPDGLAVLLSVLQRCIDSTRNYTITSRPDLQIAPKPGYVYKLAVLVTVTVAPGRTDEYEKNTRQIIAVLGKTNAKAVHVSSVGLGGNPDEYRTLVAFDNFADLQNFIPVFNKAASEAKLAPETGIVLNADMQVYKILPELSIE